jgi:hypothetical protein
LPHSPQIRAGKAAKDWLSPDDVFRQLSDDAIPPFRAFYFAADGFPDLPIKINQGGIDRLKRFLTRGLNEFENLAKKRKVFYLVAFGSYSLSFLLLGNDPIPINEKNGARKLFYP